MRSPPPVHRVVAFLGIALCVASGLKPIGCSQPHSAPEQLSGHPEIASGCEPWIDSVYELQRQAVVADASIIDDAGPHTMIEGVPPDSCVLVADSEWDDPVARANGIWAGLREVAGAAHDAETPEIGLERIERWVENSSAYPTIESWLLLYLGERALELSDAGRLVVGEREIQDLEEDTFWGAWAQTGMAHLTCDDSRVVGLYREVGAHYAEWVATSFDARTVEVATAAAAAPVRHWIRTFLDGGADAPLDRTAIRELERLACIDGAVETERDALMLELDTYGETALLECIESRLAEAECLADENEAP